MDRAFLTDQDPGDESDFEPDGGVRVPSYPRRPDKSGGTEAEIPADDRELELVGS